MYIEGVYYMGKQFDVKDCTASTVWSKNATTKNIFSRPALDTYLKATISRTIQGPAPKP